MVVSCHVIEEEMSLTEVIGFAFADEVLVAWGQTVVVTWNTELLEGFDHFVLEV